VISVVIPAFNCDRFIAEAVQSVLVQGRAVSEVIVADDGSTDATAKIVERFGPPVRLLRGSNGGPAAARNRAIKSARSDYIAFLDADDVWLPGKIDAQWSYLETHPDVRFLFSGFELWEMGEHGEDRYTPARFSDTSLWRGEAMAGWLYPALLLDSIVHTITVLMHRSVFDVVGDFDETLRTGEDYDYWLRVSRHFEMHALCKSLARYRLHSGGATRPVRSESNELKVLMRAIERFGLTGPDGRGADRSALRRRIATLWFDHGHSHFWNGDPTIAKLAFRNSFTTRREGRSAAYWAAAQLRCLFRHDLPPKVMA
jgi:glycosyltransferase involved in cell wall biosynthesis